MFHKIVWVECISVVSVHIIIESKSCCAVPEIGNWTKAHFSPNRFSGSSIGKGLSNARSGLDPF